MELYDKVRAPKQFTNLAGVGAHLETRTRLQGQLKDKLARIHGD
jgi:hypothetical protein